MHANDLKSARKPFAVNAARESGRRVIAVGTTTVRTLETVARQNAGTLNVHKGKTDIFIFPPAQFQIVDAPRPTHRRRSPGDRPQQTATRSCADTVQVRPSESATSKAARPWASSTLGQLERGGASTPIGGRILGTRQLGERLCEQIVPDQHRNVGAVRRRDRLVSATHRRTVQEDRRGQASPCGSVRPRRRRGQGVGRRSVGTRTCEHKERPQPLPAGGERRGTGHRDLGDPVGDDRGQTGLAGTQRPRVLRSRACAVG